MRERGPCPGCQQHIYKMRGDALLRCHRCGWTEGWPLVRWVTHFPRRAWNQSRHRRHRILRELQVTVKWLTILSIVGGVATGPVGVFDEAVFGGGAGDEGSIATEPRETAVANTPEAQQSVDSDGDNLPNTFEETLDTANPHQKDLYVTVVYGQNMERLSDGQIDELEQRFDAMPVSNPNGEDGIRLHILNQQGVEENITWSRSTFDSARQEYYTKARLGNWHCRSHMVVIGEGGNSEVWGYGSSPGHFVVTNGTYDFVTQDGRSVEVQGTIHELLHNIVGPFPESFDNVSTTEHTKTGYLSHADSLEDGAYMDEPTSTLLSSRGFSKPPENAIGAC